MNTNEIAKEYRLAHWAQLMQERKEKGLSIKAFCLAEGFHENVYFYWQRKLREASCEALLSNRQDESADTDTALVPSGWAICKTAESKDESTPITVEINGYRVHISESVDMGLLANVCRMLKSSC